MRSDTALAAATGTVTGTAERGTPASDILDRLIPDDLYPARLTGPHSWHPWGLTVRQPTHHQVRLVVFHGATPDSLAGLFDRIEEQLKRTPWPPGPTLQVERRGLRIDCRDASGHRSVIALTIQAAKAESTDPPRDVVTRDGWPIVDELGALNDRLTRINPDRPTPQDLKDLANWVHHKMAAPAVRTSPSRALPRLLLIQAENHPDASSRLGSILDRGIPHAGTDSSPALTYLQDQHRHVTRLGIQFGGAYRTES